MNLRRDITNRNEKSDRNKSIFDERKAGAQIIDISRDYNLSVPRVHRIIMQEENKYLRGKVSEYESIMDKKGVKYE